ncbi:Ger(x)C family spore germination protein [Paenibacillus sinopodophylli]|uniref:Ger(x)C family spore germination protein n=1 Tax=Paenibacillus sinopodophylli TaxID=1837342 RepID=UPI00110CE1A4|nr:Ger(x)C family spore germination protein [Paenibacillus sinopodophylli]
MRINRSPIRFIRIASLFLSLSTAAMLLQGCWDRVEINDLAIILATGIDVTDKQRVHISVQIFIPRQSGSSSSGSNGGSAGSPSSVTMVQTADGDNIAEAMNRLQRKLSRHVFWGHCEAIVIGKDAASSGIRQYLDFLLRFPQIREHAYVYVSEQHAVETIALLPPLERSSAEVLREMGNMKLGTKVTVLNLAESIDGLSKSAVLSRLKIIPSAFGQSKYATMPYVRGLALFKNDRYIKSIAEPNSIGMLIMLNQLENIVFTVKPEGEKTFIAIQPSNITTDLTPKVVNGKWAMDINVRMRGQVILNSTNLSLLDSKNLKNIEAAWTELIKGMVEPVLHLAQQELKTDFFGYALTFRRYQAKEWAKNKENWEKIYPNVYSNLSIQTRIFGTGKSNDPQGIPGQADKRNK